MLLNRPRHLVAQVLCVPSGESQACRWTAGHRARLYSKFTVLVRYRHASIGWVYSGGHVVVVGRFATGVVRSFTLGTRAQTGLYPVAHRLGDAWVGWPPDFFQGHDRDLATKVTAAYFRSFITPIAAPLLQEANATNCSGG